MQTIEHYNTQLNKLRVTCVDWAKNKDNIIKIILFGSKVDGVRRSSEEAKESDWDIAVEFNPILNDENHLTTWVCEKDGWQKEFEAVLNDKDFGVIDFQGYHPEAKHNIEYVKQKSIVLFDRSIHC